eukprot:GHVN01094759.1.p1 GENE.GHVN01094759.1~~GHVN01094759.1.p1  ORF type:complete len:643 (+),score=252.00 GHVN01094759.1:809-2737(+)
MPCHEMTDSLFLEMVLDAGVIGAGSVDLVFALTQWKRVISSPDRWSPEWSLLAVSALDVIALSVSHVLEGVREQVQQAGEVIGKGAKIDRKYTMNFGEEVVRGHPLFTVSSILQSIQGEVRSLAGLSSWQVMSAGKKGVSEVLGKVVKRELSEMTEESHSPHQLGYVVLCNSLTGLEDIPPHVRCVLTHSQVDLLSHVAIRARNQGVMMASCTDAPEWAELSLMADEVVSVSVVQGERGEVQLRRASDEEVKEALTLLTTSLTSNVKVDLASPSRLSSTPVKCGAYRYGEVGGKALSLQNLTSLTSKTKLSEVKVNVPTSFALPFGCFEELLKKDTMGSSEVSEKITSLISITSLNSPKQGDLRRGLKKVRKAAAKVKVPKDLQDEVSLIVRSTFTHSPHLTDSPDSSDLPDSPPTLWSAVRRVWASKWSERAYRSRRAHLIDENKLFMGVVIMEIVPAQYAFVLHTHHPISHSREVVTGEVVVGLGEVLVSNSPGSPLTFSSVKGSGEVKIHSMPSKIHGLFAQPQGSLIARSDSNGEDLEGFAGAGLYDSVCVNQPQLAAIDYANERLVWDDAFRTHLLTCLVKLASEVEELIEVSEAGAKPTKGALSEVSKVGQDVEGCVTVGEGGELVIHLLQSRPQV